MLGLLNGIVRNMVYPVMSRALHTPVTTTSDISTQDPVAPPGQHVGSRASTACTAADSVNGP